MFGEVDYHPGNAYTAIPLEEQLQALGEAKKAGKVRFSPVMTRSSLPKVRC